VTDSITPTDFDAAAAALAAAAAARRSVRITGGATKLHWGAAGDADALELHSAGLNRTLEHNVGDLTAIFEAGVPLAQAQAQLAQHGQMLAVDPPLGSEGASGATLGGVFATADSGPLRHRYGQPRDLIVGITVALSDGTIAKAGGKVIKNVAGYDLAKLFTGSFGTLGMILSVSVRLHPLPQATATVLGESGDPGVLSAAAVSLAREPLELDALDVAWRSGQGRLLARCAGVRSLSRADGVVALMRTAGLTGVAVEADDTAIWERQRAAQRSTSGAIVRVAARPTDLPAVIAAVEGCGGGMVGRALGTSYVELHPERIGEFRTALPARAVATVLDGRPSVLATLDTWGAGESPALELMRRVKQRFDPLEVCNRGVFVGGI
jgi:glycolate dehydrogenase FAD-binding subunit